jgi:kynurenine formamidase
MRIRTHTVLVLCSLGALAIFEILSLVVASSTAQAQSHPTVTKEMVDQWITEVSNAGRWGKDDEMGTINLITPAKRKQAASLVKEGVSFSLAHVLETEKAPDNANPFELKMHVIPGVAATDTISVSYHGYIHTHMDAMGHFLYHGKFYNGFPQELITENGAAKGSIYNYRNGIFTRGILMDIARLKGVDYLEPGTHIYPEDLDAWEKKAHVKVGPGDVILIRTGRFGLRAVKGPWDIRTRGLAGLDASCLKWLRARDIAICGSDTESDVTPSGVEGFSQPIHIGLLVGMGAPIFDNCDLETVSKEANQRQRWEFLLTAAPLAISGGTGSPVNPIATF